MKKIEDGRKPTEFRLNGIVHLTDALRFRIERHGVELATVRFRSDVGSGPSGRPSPPELGPARVHIGQVEPASYALRAGGPFGAR